MLRNGVDFQLFNPVPRDQARAETGISGKTLLSVGLLIERKGHHLIIEALPALPGLRLVIVGDGRDTLYSWGNAGRCVDLLAPGVDIYGACASDARCGRATGSWRSSNVSGQPSVS